MTQRDGKIVLLGPKPGLQAAKKYKIHVIRIMVCVRLGEGAMYKVVQI